MVIDSNLVIILSNTIIMTATLIATLYRIKIENKQVKLTEENIATRKCLKEFQRYIKLEREEIKKMTPKELDEFIDGMEHLGEE